MAELEPTRPLLSARHARVRRLELLAFVAVAFILTYQLLLPPIVGMANNGDYPRIMGRFNIGFPPGAAEPGYRKFLIRKFDVSSSHRWISGFVTSQSLIVMMAVPLNNLLSKDGFFDIRSVGVANSLLLLLAVWLAILASRPWPWEVRLIVCLLSILFFTDVDYVAYFNSFYSEPASLVFFLLSWCLALLVITKSPTGGVWWGWLLLSSSLFLLAKPQNVLAGLVLAAWFLRLGWIQSDSLRKGLGIAAAALLLAVSAASFALTPLPISQAAYHVAVFYELLGHSPNPSSDLRELELDGSLVQYAGTHPWSAKAPTSGNPEFKKAFTSRFRWRRLLVFYLHHPGRLIQSLDRSARAALLRENALGNFEQDAGNPPRARSRAFAVWSHLREQYGPGHISSLALFFAAYAVSLGWLWLRSRSVQRRLLIEFTLGTLIIMALQFLTIAVTSGTIDTRKHMYLFKAGVDVLLLAGASGCAAGIRSWFGSKALIEDRS
ncbi:MAG: hypothetical protein ABI718_03700 [Acidobacteriota bacterium]